MNIVTGLLAHRKRLRNTAGSDYNGTIEELSKKACMDWRTLDSMDQARLCSSDASLLAGGPSGVLSELSQNNTPASQDNFETEAGLSLGYTQPGSMHKALLSKRLCSKPRAYGDSVRKDALMARKELIDHLLQQSAPLQSADAECPRGSAHSTSSDNWTGASAAMAARLARLQETKRQLERCLNSATDSWAVLDAGNSLSRSEPVGTLASEEDSPGSGTGTGTGEGGVYAQDRIASVCNFLTAEDVRCLFNYKEGCVRRTVVQGLECWSVRIIQLSSLMTKKRKGLAPKIKNPRIAEHSLHDPVWRKKTGLRWKYINIGTFPTEPIALDAYHHISNFVYRHCVDTLKQRKRKLCV